MAQFTITRKRANFMLGAGLVQLFGPLLALLIAALVIGPEKLMASTDTFILVVAAIIVLAGALSVYSALSLRKYIVD